MEIVRFSQIEAHRACLFVFRSIPTTGQRNALYGVLFRFVANE